MPPSAKESCDLPHHSALRRLQTSAPNLFDPFVLPQTAKQRSQHLSKFPVPTANPRLRKGKNNAHGTLRTAAPDADLTVSTTFPPPLPARRWRYIPPCFESALCPYDRLKMDGAAFPSDDLLDPPPRLFERLRQIAGYTWDESQAPIHTSFDVW